MYFWNYLEKQVWNNAFSYEDRKRLGSKCKLYIPEIMDKWKLKIDTLLDSGSSSEWQEKIKNFLDRYLKLWKKIVFEEVENNKLLSFTWLENYLSFKLKNSQIYIFDNHNVAFYFLAKYFEKNKQKLDLIHIDQHSDMREPDFIPKKLENIEKYTFEWLNVWNYLIPLQKLWIIWNIYQCRTQTSVLEINDNLLKNSILNIDLDFWEENMATDKQSLDKIKQYIGISPIVLIATSPYFIAQKRAVQLIYDLFK